MSNPSLFQSTRTDQPITDTTNLAGGAAYSYSAKHHLAQLVATGTFNGAYYAKPEEQLATFRKLVTEVNDSYFLAALGIWGRHKAFMKDTPTACVAELASKGEMELFHLVFHEVIDNGRMLRNIFQMINSGAFGRKCMSYSIKRAFSYWFNNQSINNLISATIGNNPSLRKILRLIRPKPVNRERAALFAWMVDKPSSNWGVRKSHGNISSLYTPSLTDNDLPYLVRLLNSYRAAVDEATQVDLIKHTKLRWDLLADQARGVNTWKAIARHCMGFQALRMNLNTLYRHKVLEDKDIISYIADRLSDKQEVIRSRQFPVQFFNAYKNATSEVPQLIKSALNKAAEIACGNIPEVGDILIGVDVSGSMSCPLTGTRGKGQSSAIRVVDAAALFAAAILRRNPNSILVPFDTAAYEVKDIDPYDTISTIASRLAKYGGGGTNCSLPLMAGNTTYVNHPFNGVILLSDNASWVGNGIHNATLTINEWSKFRANQKRLGIDPKMVCVDMQSYGTTQAPDSSNILNLGGFSDQLFTIMAGWLSNSNHRLTQEIDDLAMELRNNTYIPGSYRKQLLTEPSDSELEVELVS